MKKQNWIQKQKESKQRQKAVHSFSDKICHWDYCVKCGLVALKNAATERAIRAPCDDGE